MVELQSITVGIQSRKPTPGQELLGRVALALFGILIASVGAALCWFSFRMIFFVSPFAGDASVWFYWPMLILASFFVLSGLVLALLSVIRTDTSPRVFRTVTRIFDGFWSLVRTIGNAM